MTEPRPRSAAPAIGLAVVAVACLIAMLSSSAEPEAETDTQSIANEPGAEHGRKLGHSATTLGQLRSRPVDPASPGYEGKEDDDWDTIGPSARIERTERIVDDVLTALDDDAPSSEHETLRRRGLLALSAARADYFSDASGKSRYIQLEQALER
jgi:hypothetical protein